LSKEYLDIAPKTFILGGLIAGIAAVINVFVICLLHDYPFNEWSWVYGAFNMTLVALLFYMVIRAVRPDILVRYKDVVVVYTMVLISTAIVEFAIYTPMFFAWIAYDSVARDTIGGGADLPFIPSLWVNKMYPARLAAIFKGPWPKAVDWALWTNPMMFWIAFFTLLSFMLLGLNVLFRKQFIEVERLPFPFAQAITEAFRTAGIEGLESSGEKTRRRSFLAGGLFALVLTLPFLLGRVAPWFFETWLGQAFIHLFPLRGEAIDLTAASEFLKSNNICLYLNLSPIFIALAFLMPLDVMLSVIIWVLVMFVILPPLSIALGLRQPVESPTAFDAYLNFGHWNMTNPLSPVPNIWGWGMWTGLGLGVILLNLKQVVKNVKEGLAYRDTPEGRFVTAGLGMFVVGFVGVVALSALSNLGMFSVLIPLWVLFVYMSMTRVRAEASFWTLCAMYGPWLHQVASSIPFMVYVQAGAPEGGLGSAVAGSCLATILLTDRGLVANPQSHAMESFKLAEPVRLNPLKLLGAQAMAAIIGLAISFPLVIWGTYFFGPGNQKWVSINDFDYGLWRSWIGGPAKNIEVGDVQNFLAGANNLEPNWWWWQWHFVAGIIAAIVLLLLKTYVIGFPLNPVGFLLGSSFTTGVFMFTCYIVAYGIKFVILKYAGTEVYRKKAFPFAAGLFMFGMLLRGIAEIISFL